MAPGRLCTWCAKGHLHGNDTIHKQCRQASLLPKSIQPPSRDMLTRLRTLCQSHRPLRCILKAARLCAIEAFIGVLDACVADNDAAFWTDLLTFSYSAFALPASRADGKVSPTKLVKQNLALPLPSSLPPPCPPSRSALNDVIKHALVTASVSVVLKRENNH